MKAIYAALLVTVIGATTAHADSIDQVKAKPAKYVVTTAAPIDQVNRCLKKTYGQFDLNVIDNADQTKDAEVSFMGHRLALLTMTVAQQSISIESRGAQAGIVENPNFRECVGLPAKAT